MELKELRRLYQEMKLKRKKHQQFKIKIGAVTFECLFSAPPFELSMTTLGVKKPEFFLFDIKRGFKVDESINKEDYSRLCRVLRTQGSSGNKLIPKEWFQNIEKQIPATLTKEPSKEKICCLRHDIEERNKPFFDG